MGKQTSLITGAGIGIGLMYFLDPNRGRRRRALVRDKAVSFWTKSGDALETTGRNVRDRVHGMTAEVRSRVGHEEEQVPDQRLVQRVRSKIGRVVSHPRAIQVAAGNGHVTLSGPILQEEVDRLLSTVRAIRGVRSVENRLEVHTERDIPSLQGGTTRPGSRWEIMQTNWSPSLRLLMAGVGSGAAVFGALRRGPVGWTMTGAGAAALARSLTNLEFSRIFGIGAGRRAVEVHKTITIDAPIEQVYNFWTRFENFPDFMSHIKEVSELGDGRSHWVAEGPAKISVQWDAVVTRQEPNRVIAWRSEPGSAVQHAGMVHFWPLPDGRTQVDVLMSYNPPAGAMGHAVAAIFGADPKRAMDDDLMRLKSILETRHRSPLHDEMAPQRSL